MKKLFARIWGKNPINKADIINLIESIKSEVEERKNLFPRTLQSVSVRSKLNSIVQKNEMYLHEFFEQAETADEEKVFEELHGKIIEYRVIVVNILTHLEKTPSFEFEEMYAGNLSTYNLAMKYIEGFKTKVLQANLTEENLRKAQTMRSQVLREICLQINREGQTYENSKILLERAKLLPQNYSAFKEALVTIGMMREKKSLSLLSPPSE